MIKEAARELRISESEVVDLCVIEELGGVLRKEISRQSKLPELAAQADALKERRHLSAKEAIERARADIKARRAQQ